MSKKLSIISLILGVIVIITCKELKKEMLVSTNEVTAFTTNSAEATGSVIDLGEGVTQHGHCWSTTASVTNSVSTKTLLGVPSGTGGFTSQLSGLTAGTKYYVKAYMTNSAETVYSKEVSFTTAAASAPTLSTTAISAITSTTASGGGNITSNGGATITASGVCWSTSSNPTIALSTKTSDGATGTFVSSITGLTANTTYYVKAYATNSAGTSYGNEISFTTSSPTIVVPTLSTTAASSITQTTASSGGIITSNGGASITTSGLCWSTSTNPTIALSTKTTNGTATGTFVSSITGLTANTTYYVKAYATNSAGTAYGNEISFITSPAVPSAPTIGTATAGNITAFVAFTSPANNGGSAITGYTATSNPGAITGTGTGSPITVTGLTNGTAYTFTVTATNVNGTGPASSASNSITPSAAPTVPGSPTGVTALAGNAQATVSFTSPVSNGGSAITGYTATSNPSGFVGTGTTSPVTVTGLTNGTAYTFTVVAINTIGNSVPSSASNSVTPLTVPGAPTIGTASAGNAQATVTFSIPGSNGGTAITGYTVTSSPGSITGTGSASPITVNGLINGTTYTFTVVATNSVGNSLASSATNSVKPSTIPGAPTIGTAIKGNGQANVAFTTPASDGGSSISAYTATSNPGGLTGTGSSSPITVAGLANGTAYTFTVTATNSNGPGAASSASNSVIPSTVPGAPTIGTAIAGNTQTTITFTAPISNGGSAITGYTATSSPGSITGTGSVSPITVSGLAIGTAYTFTIKATNANGNSSPSSASNSVTPPATVTDINGNVYKTVTIGTQTWLAENLKTTKYNDGTAISNITVNATWMVLTTGAYCDYNNTLANSTTYGRLYNWFAVDNNSATKVASNGGKNVCPISWHVPSDAEWTTLTTYLGGESVAGGKLKETGTVHWLSPNTDATNETGFTTLPGGLRNDANGVCGFIGYDGWWWSSTGSNSTNGWYRTMTYNKSTVYRDNYTNQIGYSVRCVKD